LSKVEQFVDTSAEPAVRGFLHIPEHPSGDALALTHGAGANCRSNLLRALSEAFANSGVTVLAFDLPFRQARPFGPPPPGSAQRDRDGIRRAIQILQARVGGRTFVGGHSYGGRQASMLLAEEPELAAGLLLLSYPLHPPRKPTELRTAHFPKLTRPALFVHGTRDVFGTIEEMKAAVDLISGRHLLMEITGAGHELLPRKGTSTLPTTVVERFQEFYKP
jgi:predicted alpha/beta-hydrolase family hydrolase